MFDEILHLAFLAIVENVFFRVGHFLIRVVSLGSVTISSRKPIVTFTVALLGLVATVVVIAIVVQVA